MEIMSKKEARRRGMHKYFTGVPCIRGHLGLRYANSGACMNCVALYSRKAYQNKTRKHPQILVKSYVYHQDDVAALQKYAELLNEMRK